MHIPFWLTTTLLFPVLLYQGKRTRKNTPRLPEANVVLLSMGVNDTTGFTPRYRFRRQLLALHEMLALSDQKMPTTYRFEYQDRS